MRANVEKILGSKTNNNDVATAAAATVTTADVPKGANMSLGAQRQIGMETPPDDIAAPGDGIGLTNQKQNKK